MSMYFRQKRGERIENNHKGDTVWFNFVLLFEQAMQYPIHTSKTCLVNWVKLDENQKQRPEKF